MVTENKINEAWELVNYVIWNYQLPLYFIFISLLF